MMLVNVTTDRYFTPETLTWAINWHIESAASHHSYRDSKTRVTWIGEVVQAKELIAQLLEADEHIFGWYMEQEKK